ncbi:MAG: thioredoxin fold domain-containing protein [Deltaproteobacteria bacterium]|nr:thioredoxin fold domain-containing protein [Deltaproteobacteria bacterium]
MIAFLKDFSSLRRLSYRPLVVMLVLLFAGVARAEGPSTSQSADGFFDLFMGDLGEELQTAREEGKKGILLFFEIDSCPFCIRMKRRLLSRADVQDIFGKAFLRFSVDVEGDVEITDFRGKTMREKDFALNQRVRGTPTMIFYNLKGKEVTRYVGAIDRLDNLLLLEEYVTGEVYRKMPFIRYKRLHRNTQNSHVP